MGTDESAFNAVLASRSWAQLRQIMAEYQAMRGNTLEKAVVSEFSANAEKGLLGICKSLHNIFDYNLFYCFNANCSHSQISAMRSKPSCLLCPATKQCSQRNGHQRVNNYFI